MEKPDFLAFFHSVFAVPEQRRLLLTQWHTRRAKMECATLAEEFHGFLHAVLYAPMRFYLHADHFCLFGPLLPVRYAWLKEPSQRDFIQKVHAHRNELFSVRKEVENKQFECCGLTLMLDAELVDFTVRRQLARDFVWMCMRSENDPNIHLNLIVAIQKLLTHNAQGKCDVFLAALHQALQGRCDVREVVCWGNSAYDLHPEQKK